MSLASATCAFAAGAGVRQENIVDPGFNMTAYTATIPSDWKFQGAYIPGSSCAPVPYPVARSYSTDGLTEFRRLPQAEL